MTTLREHLKAQAKYREWCSGIQSRIATNSVLMPTAMERYSQLTRPSFWFCIIGVTNKTKADEIMRVTMGAYQPLAKRWIEEMLAFANNQNIPGILAVLAKLPEDQLTDDDSRILLCACRFVVEDKTNEAFRAIEKLVRVRARAEKTDVNVISAKMMVAFRGMATAAEWAGELT